MTVFANRSYTLTGEIPTLSYTWSLKKVPLSGGASPYREYPPSPPAVTMKVFGSLYVSGKLPTYPSPKPTFCPKWEVSVKCWLRGGVGWQFPSNVPKFFLVFLYSYPFQTWFWYEVLLGIPCNYRPCVASHSRSTKKPCWRTKVVLGQDKQKAYWYIIVNGNFLYDFCSQAWRLCATWMASCNERI